MIPRYQLVIFDWEGTLSDSLGLILDLMASTAKLMKAEHFDREKAALNIGYDMTSLVRRLYPEWPPHRVHEFCDKYRLQHAKKIEQVKLFDGVKLLLEALHDAGALLAIVTGKSALSLDLALKQTQTEMLFFMLKTPDNCPVKPNPQAIEEILDAAGLDPSQAVFVGDSPTDIECGVHAKVSTIGVDFSARKTSSMLLDVGAIEAVTTVAALRDCLFLKQPH